MGGGKGAPVSSSSACMVESDSTEERRHQAATVYGISGGRGPEGGGARREKRGLE